MGATTGGNGQGFNLAHVLGGGMQGAVGQRVNPQPIQMGQAAPQQQQAPQQTQQNQITQQDNQFGQTPAGPQPQGQQTIAASPQNHVMNALFTNMLQKMFKPRPTTSGTQQSSAPIPGYTYGGADN